MKHILEVLISLLYVYRDHRVTNLWPYWPSLEAPSLPRLCGNPPSVHMEVWRRVNKHQPASALWWEPQKDPLCRRRSEQLVKCCRVVSHVHIMPCPFSVKPFTILKPLPTLIRLWLFLLPLSRCLHHPCIRPSSATFSYLILCPNILLKIGLHSFFFLLLHNFLFFFPFTSCYSMDLPSFRGYDVIWGIYVCSPSWNLEADVLR